MANFFRIGAAALAWKNTGSWSSTSGGVSNGIDEPSASDDVFFDSNSPSSVEITEAAVGLTLTIDITLTFTGAFGFTVQSLICNSIAAITISFKESITYTITELFDAHKSRVGSIVLFTSSHASTKANILMPNNGNNSCNILASFTRIDASGGRTIMTFGGTLTDCINIKSYTDKDNYATSMAA